MTFIRAYHSSPDPEIREFRAGTHFGTMEAAIERAGAGKYSNLDMVVYTVDLHISNPLEIYDDGGVHTLEYVVSAIRSVSRKILNSLVSDFILRIGEEQGEDAGFSELYSFLRQQGRYDALCYENNTEGPEDMSWIIFTPDQAFIRECNPIPTSALAKFRS